MIPTADTLKAVTDKAVEDFQNGLEKQAEDFLNDPKITDDFLRKAHNRNRSIVFDFKGDKYCIMPYVKKKVEALGYHTIVVDQTYLKIDWSERR